MRPMTVGAAFLQYVLEQLARTGRVTSRRMFGGVGLYCDTVFFGLIDDAFVLTWLTGALLSETERFLEWEKTKGRGPSVIAGQVLHQ